MVKIIPTWIDNISSTLNEITPSVERVILSGPNEFDYYRMGGDSTFLIRCIDKCRNMNIPVTLVTGFSGQFDKHPIDWTNDRFKSVTLIEWPTYWFTRTVNLMSMNKSSSINKENGLDIFDTNVCLNSECTHLYITMNNIAKNHRCLMMDLLARYKLIEKGAVAWRDVRREIDHERHLIPEGMTDSEYCNYPYRYWKPKRMLLDQFDTHNISDQELLPMEYNNAFMQLVAETSDNMFCLSEKTAVPLLFNKPFLIAGSRYFHKNLKTLGFQLYDEIFDYSFDSEKDTTLRYDRLIQNIFKYREKSPDDLKKMLKSVEPKLLHNRKLALEYAFDKIPEAISKLFLELENSPNINNDQLFTLNTALGKSLYEY